jgi:hypothetical protein
VRQCPSHHEAGGAQICAARLANAPTISPESARPAYYLGRSEEVRKMSLLLLHASRSFFSHVGHESGAASADITVVAKHGEGHIR